MPPRTQRRTDDPPRFVTTREFGFTEAEALARFDELREQGLRGGFDLSIYDEGPLGWTVAYTTER